MVSMKKLFGIVCLVGVILFCAFQSARMHHISGDCMEPAVMSGSRVFVNELSPYFRNPGINDIVVFGPYEDKMWISRVVGLSGDTIEINDKGLFVNGSLQKVKGFVRDWNNWKYGTHAVDAPLTIPEGHVYVLSDKLSAHHDDSRVFGTIPKSSISGYVW